MLKNKEIGSDSRTRFYCLNCNLSYSKDWGGIKGSGFVMTNTLHLPQCQRCGGKLVAQSQVNYSQDLSSGTSIAKWPNWLRWMLSVIVYSIMPFFTLFYAGPTWVLPTTYSGAMAAVAPIALYLVGFSQVLFSTALAPKHQLKAANVFATLNTVHGIVLLLLADDALKSISLIITGWVSYLLIKNHFSSIHSQQRTKITRF